MKIRNRIASLFVIIAVFSLLTMIAQAATITEPTVFRDTVKFRGSTGPDFDSNNSFSIGGTKVTATAAELNAVTADVTALEGATGVLNTAVSALNGATGVLNTAVGALNGATGVLNTAVTSLNGSTNALNDSVVALEGATGVLNTAVGSLNNATNALDTSVTALNEATNVLDTSVIALNEATNAMNTLLSTALQPGIITLGVGVVGALNGDIAVTNSLASATTMTGWWSASAGGAADATGLVGFNAGANTTLLTASNSTTVVFTSHTDGKAYLTVFVDVDRTNYFNVVQRDGAIKSSEALILAP